MSAVAGLSALAVAGTTTRLCDVGPRDAPEAVVFVHGNPGSADDWTALAAAVAASGRRAVAFDLPDFGETVAPPGFVHSVDGYARFLAAGIEALGIERVHLVLHDFGGPIGLSWLAGHLDQVASVTLIDTGAMEGYRWHRLARIWRTPVLGELFQAVTTRRGFQLTINRGEPRGLPQAFLDTTWSHIDRRTKRAILKLYRATDDPGRGVAELGALLAPRNLPALVIWGEHDIYLASSMADRQRAILPLADVHVLPASGHWPFVDAPETVERLLLEHLDGAWPQGSSADAASEAAGAEA
ncbi:alpha/beta hydrolase [Conexibacter sp. JD483]|uniref:alpha/beta fold hydrolase n=1 Tax=unclassified Conexibacter TaxID=2627773 RepID=UPI002717D4AF|nr:MULTISPECIES: alpha/beta hydrolase [unclassified Conexibacter]MDO8188907.1 alpha/beta hydrolase [Conexibacter sp. CPCC 205706]MDO8200262.1 alpha/beta hydrolase [Conexibacter sp. CPCC 205762]MDR9371617.1 alpha/beta hydrolase [Conexibacter sp. JD483]